MRWTRLLPAIAGGLVTLAVVRSEPGLAADGPKYSPASSCKKCHFKQYKSWKDTSMALTFEKLKPGVAAEAKTKAGLDPNADYTHDAKCLPCHTTGYGKPGGFVSIEETPELAGIACDSCHGPSESYLEIMTIKYKSHPIKEMTDLGLIYPSTEAQCVACHNDESPFNASVDPAYAFDFATAVRDAAGTHEHKPLKGEHPDLAGLGTLFQ